MPEHENQNHLSVVGSFHRKRHCLACGDPLPTRRRRYCTTACQHDLLAALNRRTGLLKALRARYATFYFSDVAIMIDLLLYGSEQVHSFMLPRSTGSKPVDDFRHLSNLLGNLWWSEKYRTNKRYLASSQVLRQAYKNHSSPNSVMPEICIVPSIKSTCLIRLQLNKSDLSPGNLESTIKRAYRQQAMKYHPDLGGSRESFIKVQEAYERLTAWAKRPTFTHQRGFPDKWLYEGARNRWLKPTPQHNKPPG